MTTMSANHRPLPEMDLDARTVDDLARILVAVEEAGYGQQVARGLIAWLVVRRAGVADHSGAPTRSRYRRILAELDRTGPPAAGPPRMYGMSSRAA